MFFGRISNFFFSTLLTLELAVNSEELTEACDFFDQSLVVLVRWLFDWCSRYVYHGSLPFGSHWVTGALGEGETMVTTRTRNTGLTRLPLVAFMPVHWSLSWWVFMGG